MDLCSRCVLALRSCILPYNICKERENKSKKWIKDRAFTVDLCDYRRDMCIRWLGFLQERKESVKDKAIKKVFQYSFLHKHKDEKKSNDVTGDLRDQHRHLQSAKKKWYQKAMSPKIINIFLIDTYKRQRTYITFKNARGTVSFNAHNSLSTTMTMNGVAWRTSFRFQKTSSILPGQFFPPFMRSIITFTSFTHKVQMAFVVSETFWSSSCGNHPEEKGSSVQSSYSTKVIRSDYVS